MSADPELETASWGGQRVDPALVELFPRAFALEHRVVPLRREGPVLVVGCERADDRRLARRVRLHAPGPLRLVDMPHEALSVALRACYGATAARYRQLRGDDLGGTTTRRTAATQLVESLLAAAIRAGASDIHFEPTADQLRVRWRVDGVLRATEALPPAKRREVLTRVLVMAGIDIAGRRRMQDGRFRVVVGRQPLDLRVSAVPTRHGESVVLRILAAESGFEGPADLGAGGELEAVFRDAIAPATGMVLFTGPTGSGKSTSIDLALALTRRPDLKVISIEDPVERVKADRTQIGVREDLDLGFAKILRHVLRHDPDVIVVGEIRDRETADVAFQAALSGHKVFSTLHTSSALMAVPRLRSLGLDAGLIAAGLAAVVAQRLVRRCCQPCAGVGCAECGFDGYLGRTGLFEVVRVDRAVRRAIRDDAPAEELERLARRAGYRPLAEEGMAKVATGATSRIEVLRATGTAR